MHYMIGQKYRGTVVDIRDYGAVLQMEDGSTQLLHISNISDKFVDDVAKFVHKGETYEVTAIPGKVKRVELTLKDVDVSQFDEENIDFATLIEHYLPAPTARDKARNEARARRKHK